MGKADEKGEGESAEEPSLVVLLKNRVVTLRLNRPRKFNAMRERDVQAIREALRNAAEDDGVGAVVLTGTGRYYSAGADFKDSMSLTWPSTLRKEKAAYNQAVFDMFLDFPKPIITAVNGPAIGMAVTSATLTDAIICSPTATFRTPFAELGLPPEGCSSINFPKMLGKANSDRMLVDGETIDAATALEIGLVKEVVDASVLAARAQELAEHMIHEGAVRPILLEDGWKQKLKEANVKESIALGKAVLSRRFFEANYQIALRQKKSDAAWTFWILAQASPLISRL